MKKNRILIYLMLIISLTLAISSIIYLINNKTVDGFNAYYTYTLMKSNNLKIGFISGIIVIGLIIIFSILYFLILKNEKQIFKNMKQIMIFISIISFIFMITLPFLSSDIYYYIGDSWLASKYNENPYYTTVQDLQNKGMNDEILNNTGYWKNTTSVYGPLWNSIAKLLVTFSFGNLTLALFIFKLASYLIHVLNSYLIYKITKNKKYALLYGLNPLVLIELLSNVHNDIYLLFFILLALYFLIRKKSIFFTSTFLALSICIKYSTVLIIPFILIYCFKNKNILKKILYCLGTGIGIIAIVIIFYMPYYRDMSIFTNMLVQGSKYSQSIMLFILEKCDTNIFNFINSILIPVFALIYLIALIIELFDKNITIRSTMKKYNLLMMLFIFLVLTTFQKWYILWLIPTIMWQTKNMKKFILYLSNTALIPSLGYFKIEGDAYLYGIGYSIIILVISAVCLGISILVEKYCKSKNIKEKKCQD